MTIRFLVLSALFAFLLAPPGWAIAQTELSATSSETTRSFAEYGSVVEQRSARPNPDRYIEENVDDLARGQDCETSTVLLNTGYDHFNGAAYPVNVPDARWTVLFDQDVNTTEPRPASTITPNPAWEPAEPNSRWIGSYPGNQQVVNGDYVFETVFCVTEEAQFVMLDIGMRADDECRAYLNESLPDILSNAATPFYVGQDFNDPDLEIRTFKFFNLLPGKNRLTIKVTNTGSVAMGLNVVATVFANPNGTAEQPRCCCGTGVIQGLKYNDLNGNGMRDPGEPTLPGWTINLTGSGYSDTTVTDNAGFYSFVGVPPDNYTITEVQQPGWVQTEPAAGGYNFTMNPLQSISGLEFGNREAGCEFVSNNILCELEDGQLTGNFVITGAFTNQQGVPGTHLLLPPNAISPAGAQLCFGSGGQVLPLNPPVNSGDSFQVGADPANSDAIIVKNAMPGDEVCFRLVLLGANGVECCSVEVCFVMPPCDCLQVDRRFDVISEVFCQSDGTIDFSYQFQLTNLFGQDIYHAFLAPGGPITFTPDYFDLFVANGNVPLGQGQSVTLKTFITGAQPEALINFLITVHNEDFSDCCSRPHDVRAPSCDDPTGGGEAPKGGLLYGDVNSDGVVNLMDVQPFVDLLSSGGYVASADINGDDAVDLSDVSPFVAILAGS